MFDLSLITRDGVAIRDGGTVHVLMRWTDDPGLLDDPAIECLNPEAGPNDRVYHRSFTHREIFMPGEYDLATQKHLKSGVRPIVVLGGNGFSNIKDHELKAWHLNADTYRVGAEIVFETNYLRIRSELGEAMDIRFVHGCSTLGMASRGIDAALINVAKRLRCQMLGFSCPRFMMYVTDETDFPVLIATNEDAYSEEFVTALDVLITCNGRAQTLKMDLNAALIKRKYAVLFDLLGSISQTGGPPAYGPNNEVEDAVKALLSGMLFVGGNLHLVPSSGSLWKDQLNRITTGVIERIRHNPSIPPEVALHLNLNTFPSF